MFKFILILLITAQSVYGANNEADVIRASYVWVTKMALIHKMQIAKTAGDLDSAYKYDLAIAALDGDTDKIKHLFKATPSATSLDLALVYAAGFQHSVIPTKLILAKGADPRAKYVNDTALAEAVIMGHPESITAILQAGGDKKTALTWLENFQKPIEALSSMPAKRVAIEDGCWSLSRRSFIEGCARLSRSRVSVRPAAVSTKRVRVAEIKE